MIQRWEKVENANVSSFEAISILKWCVCTNKIYPLKFYKLFTNFIQSWDEDRA